MLVERVDPPEDETVASAQGTTDFRGLSAYDLLHYSARHKLVRNVKGKEIKELLSILGFVGHGDAIDKVLATKTANALKYNMITRLRCVNHTLTPGGKPAAVWPEWTSQWYTDPNWDGNTDPPSGRASTTTTTVPATAGNNPDQSTATVDISSSQGTVDPAVQASTSNNNNLNQSANPGISVDTSNNPSQSADRGVLMSTGNNPSQSATGTTNPTTSTRPTPIPASDVQGGRNNNSQVPAGEDASDAGLYDDDDDDRAPEPLPSDPQFNDGGSFAWMNFFREAKAVPNTTTRADPELHFLDSLTGRINVLQTMAGNSST
ncbi:hypothetical protein W97_07744 [Coniosporium apollinis CBS 100218]|uniref:Uncharacterized protein n=1 Tax=Coniosporium apollinis (strain CBS 100218) TaxID=1168221 RepID=R7Z2J9_CONA1|nr:uncharacterized protein W97_07744 [Coniosporium apollinis CBS 100218]EON68420.1 hypothetical protein W97_07744 [Coniosporium apollinis CBS 100218]